MINNHSNLGQCYPNLSRKAKVIQATKIYQSYPKKTISNRQKILLAHSKALYRNGSLTIELNPIPCFIATTWSIFATLELCSLGEIDHVLEALTRIPQTKHNNSTYSQKLADAYDERATCTLNKHSSQGRVHNTCFQATASKNRSITF